MLVKMLSCSPMHCSTGWLLWMIYCLIIILDQYWYENLILAHIPDIVSYILLIWKPSICYELDIGYFDSWSCVACINGVVLHAYIVCPRCMWDGGLITFHGFLCGILVQLCVSNDLLIVRDLNSVSKWWRQQKSILKWRAACGCISY